MMIPSFVLSMCINNLAVCAMMMSIVDQIIAQSRQHVMETRCDDAISSTPDDDGDDDM